MATREVSAREALQDIQAGMDEDSLMKKYKLSRQGVHSLYRELDRLGLMEQNQQSEETQPKVRIKIKEIVKDIRAGMTDSDLMRKYSLTPTSLQNILIKLLDLRAITRDMLVTSTAVEEPCLVAERVRQMQRYYLDFEIPVYDPANPEIQGRVRDISESGLGIIGLATASDQLRHFVVLGDAFGVVAPFEVDARCRWYKPEDAEGTHVSGFQITSISEEDLEELKKLIRLVTLGS
jgi:uncharacterized protein (DUF433 family)